MNKSAAALICLVTVRLKRKSLMRSIRERKRKEGGGMRLKKEELSQYRDDGLP